MNKTTFLQRMRKSRRELESAMAELTREQILLPGASGDMSVKDMLAHITWHEVQMIGMIDQMALTGSPWWTLSTDERNARIYKASQGRTWEDVRAEADAVYARLYAALEKLDEAAYQDSSRFRQMPPDWTPCRIFADNTYDHYDHHLRDILKTRLGR